MISIFNIFRRFNPEPMPKMFVIFYDRFINQLREIYLKEFINSVANSFRGTRLLDVGTGPGYLLIELASRLDFATFIGVDKSKAMVKAARHNAIKNGLGDHVRFEVANGLKLPFPNDYFDFITSTCSLHHWHHPQLVFNECYRVLKYGGHLWILDNYRHASTQEIKKWIKDVRNITKVGLIFPLVFWYETRFCSYSKREIIELSRASCFRTDEIKFNRVFIIAQFTK